MDKRGHNNIKRKIEQNFPGSKGDSETELYDPSYEKDKSTRQAFLQRKRNIEKEKMKTHYLEKEFGKFSEKKNYIKYEKEISGRNKYSNNEVENLKNYFELQIQKLTNLIEQQKGQLEQTKGQLEQTNDELKKTKGKLEQTNGELEQTKNKLEEQRIEFNLKFKRMNGDNYLLKLSLKNQAEDSIQSENRLLLKINKLESQVKDLNDFHFQVKLRKLIKNLLEYLFSQYYPKFMSSNKITHKVEFIRAPIIKIKEKEKEYEKEKKREKKYYHQ